MKRNKITGRTAVRIADSIERIAHAGHYRAGDALPTIRSLAATLEVSPVTVAAAYRSLRARGLAIAEGRRGTRIRPSRSASPVGRTARALEQSPRGRAVIDLSAGNPDPALLPSLETALRHVPSASRLYGDEGRSAVAREIRRTGLRCRRDSCERHHDCWRYPRRDRADSPRASPPGRSSGRRGPRVSSALRPPRRVGVSRWSRWQSTMRVRCPMRWHMLCDGGSALW